MEGVSSEGCSTRPTKVAPMRGYTYVITTSQPCSRNSSSGLQEPVHQVCLPSMLMYANTPKAHRAYTHEGA